MATETFTRLVDDLDGSKAERTVAFSWDGRSYSIDLSKRNIAAFEKSLEPYISAARKEQSSRPARGRARGGRSAAGGRRRDLSAVRTWARANGYEVSDRGRIGGDVVAAYEAAMEG
jgi:nucleoid-associated protein Lsr2